MTLINPCNSVLVGINQNRISCDTFHYKLLCNNRFLCRQFFNCGNRKHLSFCFLRQRFWYCRRLIKGNVLFCFRRFSSFIRFQHPHIKLHGRYTAVIIFVV